MQGYRCLLYVTTAAVAFVQASEVRAQPAATDAETTAEDSGEIVITAQRREQSLTDVPITVSVADAEQLDASGVTRLEEIGQISPATQIANTGVFTQPSIRGVSSSLAGSFENNVAFYVDGVYFPVTRAINLELANVSQVQVLKGPQGTLFGRNSTGGAILVDTFNPTMGERTGHLRAGYFSFDDWRFQGYFSTPITDTLAINFAGSLRKSDGYIRDIDGFDSAPIDNKSFSTKLRFEPSDNFWIQLKYDRTEISDARGLAQAAEPSNPRSSVVLALPGTYIETRDNRTSINFRPIVTSDVDTASLTLKYDFGGVQLNALASFQDENDVTKFDRDYTKVHSSHTLSLDDTQTITADVNLTSSSPGPVQFVVGMFYFDTEATTFAYAINTNQTLALRQFQTTTAKAIAGYADVTWEVTPRLFLTGGIRVSHEKRTAIVNRTATQILFPTGGADGDVTFNDVSPRAVIRYEITDNSNVYASWSRGFRSGFISISSPFNTVKPEKIDAFEVGYKMRRGRFRLESSAFYYDFRDLQVSGSVTDPLTGLPLPLTTNAESAEVYGAEVSVAAEVVKDFNVSLGAAYTHAEYKKFTGAAVNGISPTTGLNVSACPNPNPPPATITCVQDFSGRTLNRAPKLTVNLGADYMIKSSIGTWFLSGNVSYSSKFIPTRGDLHPITGEHRYGGNAYTLVNVRLGWSPFDDHDFKISLVGQNIFDKRYYIYRTGTPLADTFSLGTPRTWGVQLDYRF